ncbi:HPr family phosphocarrier protein [Pelorhabdus rhamnosifermentans]
MSAILLASSRFNPKIGQLFINPSGLHARPAAYFTQTAGKPCVFLFNFR